MASKSSDMMRFNVGGKTFETTATTLAVAGPNSFFGPLLNGNWTVQPNHQDAIFIDRDPECFSVILNLLRTGELHIPSIVPKDLLLKEAQFYGVLDLVRAATWGPFDGNRLSLSKSITIPTNQKAKLIRASPTGGCCVSGDSIIRVYDWMLRQQSPIILEDEYVNDIVWIDSNNIMVAAQENMKLFDLSSGEQTQMIQFTRYGRTEIPSSCRLCFDNDCKIYVGCSGKGIGVLDRERSEPIDFFHSIRMDIKVEKLQWLPGTKSLLVASTYNPTSTQSMHYYCFSLLDLRQKKSALNWSQSQPGLPDSDKDRVKIHDIVMMDSRNTIFVVDKDENIGFIDLRFRQDFVFHCGKRMLGKDVKVKLAEHEGQLLSSKGDQITVYSTGGRAFSVTSNLRTNSTSVINGLSIANGRLFSLGVTSFDVWETSPLSPTI